MIPRKQFTVTEHNFGDPNPGKPVQKHVSLVHAFVFCDGPQSLRKIYQNICRMHLWNFGQNFTNDVLQALFWAGFGRFNLPLVCAHDHWSPNSVRRAWSNMLGGTTCQSHLTSCRTTI